MLKASELRIGNLILWNPALLNPNATLPPMYVEVTAVLHEQVGYTFPNLDHRVEPFEDDKIQKKPVYKSISQLEPIPLSIEVIEKCGFTLDGVHYIYTTLGDTTYKLYLTEKESYLLHTSKGEQQITLPIKYLHKLQNLAYCLSGYEIGFL